MEFTLALSWVFIGVFVLLSVVMLFLLQTGRYQQKLFISFRQTVGLPLHADDMALAIWRRIKSRNSAMFGGGLVGLLLSALVLFFNPQLGSTSFPWLVAIPALVTGMTALDAGVALRYSLFRRREDAPRLARAAAIVLSDYVSPWRLRMAPGFVLAGVVLYTIGALLGLTGSIDRETFSRSAALPLLAVAVIVLGLGMAAERKILQQTQPVAEELELAWDDAFRAITFLALRGTETIVAWLAVGAISLGMLEGLDAVTGASWGTGIGTQLFLWGFLATNFIFSLGRARTHFRHRLWPNLASDRDADLGGS
jgi:hypothetical protein